MISVVVILLLALACVSIVVVLVKKRHHSKCGCRGRYLGKGGREGGAGKMGRQEWMGQMDRWGDRWRDRRDRLMSRWMEGGGIGEHVIMIFMTLSVHVLLSPKGTFHF